MSRANDDAPEKRIDGIRSVGGQDRDMCMLFENSGKSELIAATELMVKSCWPIR